MLFDECPSCGKPLECIETTSYPPMRIYKCENCGFRYEESREIERNFTYHPPKEGQPERYTSIRNKAKEFAELIEKECPSSRERSLAFTKLEEAVMWANAAIARNE